MTWKSKSAPLPPDPWSPDDDAAARSDDALPLCPRCLTPQKGTGWFCPKCGSSVGPYNNLMPYVSIYSIGEVARAGVGDDVPRNWLTRIGYVLFAVSAYAWFFPVYLVSLAFRRRREPVGADDAPE